MTNTVERNPLAANKDEQISLENIGRVLSVLEGTRINVKLVGANGEEIELPDVVLKLLQQTVKYLAQGKAVKLIPVGMELTTQEAADLLNVSRPHLIKLLEEEKIPYKKVGTHRRINFQDLMKYKAKRNTEQLRLLAEMAQFSQDLGLYEENPDYE